VREFCCALIAAFATLPLALLQVEPLLGGLLRDQLAISSTALPATVFVAVYVWLVYVGDRRNRADVAWTGNFYWFFWIFFCKNSLKKYKKKTLKTKKIKFH
jgi:hypothetical protein